MMFSHQEIAHRLEQQIRANRLLHLPVEWTNEIIFPYYNGLSLLNIPHTIAELLNAPLPNSAPLDAAIWGDPSMIGQVDRVVMILLDGIGYQHLHMLMAEDPAVYQSVTSLTAGRGPIPLTSVAPSTTAVALPSLWTGSAPAATGMTGTLMFLREFSTIGIMISFTPTFGKHRGDIFTEWGLPPESLIAVPGLSQHLAAANTPTYLVTHRQYLNNGLSRILHRGVEHHHLHVSDSDFTMCLRTALRESRGKHCYVSAYWSAVDSLAHMHGAHTAYTHHEIRTRLSELAEILEADELQDGRTLVMITADHGHYDAPRRIDVMHDVEAQPIRDSMTLGMTGDKRLPYLYLRPGTVERVKQAIDTTYAECLTYVDLDTALEAGLFGSDNFAPQIRNRIGDLILIPRLGWIVIDPSVSTLPAVSRHAGLSDWEMLIPFMWRLV